MFLGELQLSFEIHGIIQDTWNLFAEGGSYFTA